MKKLFFAVIGLVLAVGLCSCGKPAVPSEDKVREDIAAELAVYNPNAQLQELEVVKSAQEEDVYELTVALAAQTRYADWQYQANVVYELYDQGWFLESLEWQEESYVLARYPDANDLVSVTNENEYINQYYAELLPVEQGVVETGTAELAEQLLFTWETKESYLHADKVTRCTVRYCYDAEEDDWDYSDYSESEMVLEEILDMCPTADFTGSWTGIYGPMEIQEYSPATIRLAWAGSESTFNVFTQSGLGFDTRIYENGDGYSLSVRFNRDSSWIAVYHGLAVVRLVEFRNPMPAL